MFQSTCRCSWTVTTIAWCGPLRTSHFARPTAQWNSDKGPFAGYFEYLAKSLSTWRRITVARSRTAKAVSRLGTFYSGHRGVFWYFWRVRAFWRPQCDPPTCLSPEWSCKITDHNWFDCWQAPSGSGSGSECGCSSRATRPPFRHFLLWTHEQQAIDYYLEKSSICMIARGPGSAVEREVSLSLRAVRLFRDQRPNYSHSVKQFSLALLSN